MEDLANDQVIDLYVDGRGRRPDGTGSGFAWIELRTGKRSVTWRDGLTNNEAEYLALDAAIESLPAKSTVNIFTDSVIVREQMLGNYRINEPRLERLANEIKQKIREKHLTVQIFLVAGKSNPADRLLAKPPSSPHATPAPQSGGLAT